MQSWIGLKLVRDGSVTRRWRLWSRMPFFDVTPNYIGCAYVVMVNHLHLLLRPKLIGAPKQSSIDSFVPLSSITKRIKGYTAREANRILQRTGKNFWQQESFDHWPRDEDEFFRIIAYIENNPVKAGLVREAKDWPWSSAAPRSADGPSAKTELHQPLQRADKLSALL